jgi:hypothetical protein
VKLSQTGKDSFRFQLGRREQELLLELLKLFPCIPPAHFANAKSHTLPEQDPSQRLLHEALAEHRSESQTRIQSVFGTPDRWTPMPEGWQISLSAAELDWLMQILNDIRVGSWVNLGSPEEPVSVVDETTAPHLWGMEMAGVYQMFLIHALETTG